MDLPLSFDGILVWVDNILDPFVQPIYLMIGYLP